MFVGHTAAAIGLKSWFREVPLWGLALGAVAADLLFDGLVLAGVEGLVVHPGVRGPLAMELPWMPYSHSLVTAALGGGLAVLAGGALGRWRAGAALGLAVSSHWALDWLVHRPDLHLGFGAEPRLGLGLWAWPAVGAAVELGGLALATGLACRGAPPRFRRRLGRFAAVLAVLQVGFVLAPGAGPPALLASVALVGSLVIVGGAWRVEQLP